MAKAVSLPGALMVENRRFPPPWSIEETDACFIVRDREGQAFTYVYYEDEPAANESGKGRQWILTATGSGTNNCNNYCLVPPLIGGQILATLGWASGRDNANAQGIGW